MRKELALYLFFGVCTTGVNFAAYLACTRALPAPLALAPTPAALAAWVVAVAFAFVTNKVFVFASRRASAAALAKECAMFFAARVATGVFEVGAVWVFAERLGLYDVAVKGASLAVVVAGNYLLSKFIVFKKGQK